MDSLLDLIRETGRLTHTRFCDPDCHPEFHRGEAAQVFAVLIDRSDLLEQLTRSAHTIRSTRDDQ